MRLAIAVLIFVLIPGVTRAADDPLCPNCGKPLKGWTPPGGSKPVPSHPPSPGTTPPNANTPNTPAEQIQNKTSPPWGWIIAAIAAVATIAGGQAAWILLIQPRRRRRPVLQAQALLSSDNPADLREAETLLVRAIATGLRAADLAEARFALAFARTRLGRFAEAESVLTDAERDGPLDKEAAYLQLWLLARQRKHEEVERFHAQHTAQLGDMLQTARLAGITFLQLARQHWSRREAGTALGYFERLRALNVFTDQLPQHVSDQRIVFGIMSLFEQDWTKARDQFTAVIQAAKTAGQPTYLGELGLLLCEWREQDTPDIDDDLTAVLPAIRAARDPKADPEKDEQRLLLSGCLLWHALSLLYVWLKRPAREALTPADLETCFQRLAAVKEVSPKLGDAYLIEGLLRYYLAGQNHEERQEGVRALQQAVDRDVNLPEVVVLLDRERKLDEHRREGVSTYIALVKTWLQNREVPAALRKALRRQLNELSGRFHGEFDELKITDAGQIAPSVADLQMRVALLQRRVETIVRPRLAKTRDEVDGKAVHDLLDSMSAVSTTLKHNAEDLENKEKELMLVAGEFLLREEPTPAGT